MASRNYNEDVILPNDSTDDISINDNSVDDNFFGVEDSDNDESIENIVSNVDVVVYTDSENDISDNDDDDNSTSNKKVVCEMCGSNVNVKDLVKHLKTFHNKIGAEMEQGGRRKRNKKFHPHESRESESKRMKLDNVKLDDIKCELFTCDICDMKFESEIKLLNHTMSNEASTSSRNAKTVCHFLKDFYNKNLLQSVISKNYVCKLCDFTSEDSLQMKSHLKDKHWTKDKKKSQERKTEHIVIKFDPMEGSTATLCHQQLEEDFYCEACGLQMQSKKNLLNHISENTIVTFANVVEMKCRLLNDFYDECLVKNESSGKYSCNRCHRFASQDFSKSKNHVDNCHTSELVDRYADRFEFTSSKMNPTQVQKPKSDRPTSKAGKFSCDQCSYSSNIWNHLDRHTRAVHLKERNFECGECFKKFFERSKLAAHKKTCKPTSSNIASQIWTAFVREIKSETSQVTASKGKGKRFECVGCGKQFERKSTFHRHFDTNKVIGGEDDVILKCNLLKEFLEQTLEENQALAVFRCKMCEFVCPILEKSRRHVFNEHINQFDHENSAILKSHLESKKKSNNTDTDGAPVMPPAIRSGVFQCHQCPYSTSNSIHNLDRHVRAVHLKEKNYFCPGCDKGFFEVKKLNDHVKLNTKIISETESVMRCKVSREFCDKYIACDQEEEKYSCKQCGYTTDELKKTKVHVKRQHAVDFLDQVPNALADEFRFTTYPCDKCSYTTRNRANIERHVRNVHLLERNFECPGCGRKFFELRRLRNHVKLNEVGVDDSGSMTMKCKYLNEFCNTFIREIEPSRFACNACTYTSDKKFRLTKHAKRQHWNTYVDQCPNNVIKQLKYKMFYCDQCSYTSTQNRALQKHIATVHRGGSEMVNTSTSLTPNAPKKRKSNLRKKAPDSEQQEFA